MAAFFILILVVAFLIDRGVKRRKEREQTYRELRYYQSIMRGEHPVGPPPLAVPPAPRTSWVPVWLGSVWAWAVSPEKVGWLVVRVCLLYLAVVVGLGIIFFIMAL